MYHIFKLTKDWTWRVVRPNLAHGLPKTPLYAVVSNPSLKLYCYIRRYSFIIYSSVCTGWYYYLIIDNRDEMWYRIPPWCACFSFMKWIPSWDVQLRSFSMDHVSKKWSHFHFHWSFPFPLNHMTLLICLSHLLPSISMCESLCVLFRAHVPLTFVLALISSLTFSRSQSLFLSLSPFLFIS